MEYVFGNIFVRDMFLTKTGDVSPGTPHHFDHATNLVNGRMHLKATSPDGTVREAELEPGAFILIRAETLHTFTALTDGVHFRCIYAHRTPQGEVVPNFNGFLAAYQ